MLHILDPMKILDTKGVLAVEFRKYYVRVVDYKWVDLLWCLGRY